MTNEVLVADCPSEERLRQLLDGQLAGDDFALLETHVEKCSQCQTVLAHLSDGALTDHWRRLLAEHEPSVEETRDFDISDLPTVPPPGIIPLAPGARLGAYEVQKELGRGGMGVVYLARDLELGHQVALKVLKPDLAAEAHERERFFREGRAAAAIKHDHIVRVHAASSSPDFFSPYLVMEFVDGEPLDHVLQREGSLPPLECARLVQQAALGLAAAHAKNLVHRDVKPSNLMLEAATGRIKIMDFGLVRRADVSDDHLTEAGHIVGTPVYMSPEHIVNPTSVGPLSDVFSLGVVLYEMMTGEKPFAGKRHLVLTQIINTQPRPPRQLNDAIPRDLETICLKCLRKSPTDRYTSATALADDLGRLLDGMPILARPVSRSEKLWLWCRRNPWLAGSTVASVLLFYVAFTVVTSSAWALSILNGRLKLQTTAAESAKGEAEKQANIATTQREIADQRADILFVATKDVITGAKSPVAKAPAAQPFRKAILEAMVKDLDKLKNITSTSGITERALALQFHEVMYGLYRETGDTEKAWQHLKQAHEIARQRIIDQNGSVASRLNLATICGDMAHLRQDYQRDMNVALNFAKEESSLYQQVIAMLISEKSWRLRMEAMLPYADCQSLIGSIYVRLGDPAAALASFEKSEEIRESIKNDPQYLTLAKGARSRNDEVFREKSATVLLAIGDMDFRLGQPQQAKEVYAKALAIRESVLEKHPNDAAANRLLAMAASQAGYVHMVLSDLSVASQLLTRAVTLLEPLVVADPEHVDNRRHLALVHYRLGVLKQIQADHAASKEHFEACRTIRAALAKDESNISRQREYLLALARCGDHAEATILANQIINDTPDPDIELLLDLARAYTQCSLARADDPAAAESLRASALARLSQAVKAGHHDPVYLEHEPDFTPLRTSDAFRAIVAEERLEKTAR